MKLGAPRIAVQPADYGPKPEGVPGERNFASVADLYAAANPVSEADKALVIGYWYQLVNSEPDFDSQRINTDLKNLGYGISNITQAFGSLMVRRPQLVIQTKKTGTSRQARKRYKLTSAGQQMVEQMIGTPHATQE